jgi:hypothetical protein
VATTELAKAKAAVRYVKEGMVTIDRACTRKIWNERRANGTRVRTTGVKTAVE